MAVDVAGERYFTSVVWLVGGSVDMDGWMDGWRDGGMEGVACGKWKLTCYSACGGAA